MSITLRRFIFDNNYNLLKGRENIRRKISIRDKLVFVLSFYYISHLCITITCKYIYIVKDGKRRQMWYCCERQCIHLYCHINLNIIFIIICFIIDFYCIYMCTLRNICGMSLLGALNDTVGILEAKPSSRRRGWKLLNL